MQLQNYSHISHPALYFSTPHLCPRRVCQQYLSPNISLLLSALWQMGNETFLFLFLQKRYEIPVEEKVTTSRLIVEKQAMHTDHSLVFKCRNDQSLQINVQINHRPRDRSGRFGFSLHGKKKKKEKKGKRKLETSDTDFYNLRAALCSPT